VHHDLQNNSETLAITDLLGPDSNPDGISLLGVKKCIFGNLLWENITFLQCSRKISGLWKN